MIKVHVDEDTYIEVKDSRIPGKTHISFTENAGHQFESIVIPFEHIYKLEYALRQYSKLKIEAFNQSAEG